MALTAFYGLLTVFAAVSAIPQAREVKICTAILFFGWAISTIVGLTINCDAMHKVGASLDVVAGIATIMIWRIWFPKVWIFVLAFSFLAQLSAHMTFADGPDTFLRRYERDSEINGVYIFQLAIVAFGPRINAIVDFFQGVFFSPSGRYRHRRKLASEIAPQMICADDQRRSYRRSKHYGSTPQDHK